MSATVAERPRMRGGVIRRGAGWSYVVRERDPRTGSTRPRWVSGYPTRKAAANARADALAAMTKGTYVPPSTMTVGEWLDLWLVGHASQLKASTVASYQANVERYLRPHLGHERVQHLSPARLSLLWRTLHESGGKGGKPLSARTVEFVRALLRRALADAVVERVIVVNPVTGSKVPRKVKPTHTTWTGAQVSAYLQHVDRTGHPLADLFSVALSSGARRGELLALRWSDVDLDAGVVRLERAVTVLGGARTYDTPKNHERRTVKLDADTVARLRALRVQRKRDRLAAGAAWADSDGLVFIDNLGRPVHPDTVTREFVRSQAGSGLPRITLHECRHSHATILLRAGVPVHIVAARLGHRDPSVTLNVYADAIPQDDATAVDVFARALGGGATG